MGRMQATYNGVELDNNSYRRVWGTYRDDTGFDGRRVISVEFSIKGDTITQLETRKREVEDAFTLANGRFTLTLDSAGSTLYADIAPNDGRHGGVVCKVDVNPEREQTAGCMELILSCLAEVIPSATHVAGSSTPNFTGLVGNLTYGHDFNASRVESYRVMGTWTTTFDDDANGPYTVLSVASSGGKAVFTIAEAPVAFNEGQRLKVTAGTAYLGLHLITAIDVGAKTITTDTAYSATATGTAYIGAVTTGEENYLAARATLLTDYLHVAATGGRDETADPNNTGMVLKSEVREMLDKDGNQFSAMLQSGYMQQALPGTSSARGLTLTIGHSLPQKWTPSGGGERPVYLTAKGSVPCSRTILNGDSLQQVWEAGLRDDIRAAVEADTGESPILPLFEIFDAMEEDGIITFDCQYQARNTKNTAYEVTTVLREEDDRVRALTAKGKHYDQRPPGPYPATVTVTATRTGVGNSKPFVPTPNQDAGPGCFWDPLKPVDSETPFDAEFGAGMFTVSRSIVYLRTSYEGGSGQGGGGAIGDIFNRDLADAQANTTFNDPFNRGLQP